VREPAHITDDIDALELCDFSRLSLARVRLRCRPLAPIALPAYKGTAYKGAVFHGAFGRALEKVSPAVFRSFYFPHEEKRVPGFERHVAVPKPFALLPPLDDTELYQVDEPFSLELTLFGRAVWQLPVCIAAIEVLGERDGLGPNRGRFRLEALHTYDLDGVPQPVTGLLANTSTCVLTAQQVAATRRPRAMHQTFIQLNTRLRMIHDGGLLRQAPRFSFLVDRLLKRLDDLGQLHGEGGVCGTDTRRVLRQHAKSVDIDKDNTTYAPWIRHVARKRREDNMGGLLGSVIYGNPSAAFLPLLALGQWTHAGANASFGLGRYTLSAVS